MIILLIAVFTILAFYGMTFVNRKSVSNVLGIGSMVALTCCIAVLTLHIHSHWGMDEVTVTTHQEIFTAGDPNLPFGLVVTKQIGEDSGNYVLVYRDSPNQEAAAAHFVPDMEQVSEAVKHDATFQTVADETAEVQIETTTLEFSSGFSKLLFGWGGEGGQLLREHAVVKVPENTWLVLTEEQAEKLADQSDALAKKQQEAMAANPNLASQLKELQASDPEGFARLQADQVREFLGI